jgi:5-methylcytosine-specific restriction endonuclease McrA
MAKKIPHCKKCDQDGHYAVSCRNYPVIPDSSKPKVKSVSRKSRPTVKKPSRSKLKKDLDKLVKDSVKIRDNYTCQHCLKKVTGTNCHGSHILPVGSYSNMQFDPRNIKVLCFHCHRHFWHNNPLEAGEWYKQTFTENWYYLQERSKIAPKLPTYKLQEMIDEYKRNA